MSQDSGVKVSICLVNNDFWSVSYTKAIIWFQMTWNKEYESYDIFLWWFCVLLEVQKPSFVFYRRKKAIQVWNGMWVSKYLVFVWIILLHFTFPISQCLCIFWFGSDYPSCCLWQFLFHSFNTYFAFSFFCFTTLAFLPFLSLFHFLPSLAISLYYSGVPFYIFLSPSFLSNLSAHIHTSHSSRLYDWFRLDSVI